MSDPISLSSNAADDSSSVTLKSLSTVVDDDQLHHVDELLDCGQLTQDIQTSHLNGITEPLDLDKHFEVNIHADGNEKECNELLSSVTDVPVSMIESKLHENAVASAVADATSIENIFCNDTESKLLTSCSDEVVPAESLSNGPAVANTEVNVTKKQCCNQEEELNKQTNEESIKANQTNGLIENLTENDEALIINANSSAIDLIDDSVISISDSLSSLDNAESVVSKDMSVINEEFSNAPVTKETPACEVNPSNDVDCEVREEVPQSHLNEDEETEATLDLPKTPNCQEVLLITAEATKTSDTEDRSTPNPVALVSEVVACSSILDNVTCEDVSLFSEMISDSPINEKVSTSEESVVEKDSPVTYSTPDNCVKEDTLKIPESPVSPLKENITEPNSDDILSENVSVSIPAVDNDVIKLPKDVDDVPSTVLTSVDCSSDETNGHEDIVNDIVESPTEVPVESLISKAELVTEDTNELSVDPAEIPVEPIKTQEDIKDENKSLTKIAPIPTDLQKDDSVDTDVLHVIEDIDPLCSTDIAMPTAPETLPSVPATQTASTVVCSDDVVMLLTDSDEELSSPALIAKPDVFVPSGEINATKIEHVEPVTCTSTLLPSSNSAAASSSSVAFEPVAGPSGLQATAGKQTAITDDDIIMLDDDDDDIPIPPPPVINTTEFPAIKVSCKYLLFSSRWSHN